MYRVYRGGVLGRTVLLGLLVGVPLRAVTRGCSMGEDDRGWGVEMQGVAGGREKGGGKTRGRKDVARIAGVGVAGCCWSFEVAFRSVAGTRRDGLCWANRARGVGVSTAMPMEDELTVPNLSVTSSRSRVVESSWPEPVNDGCFLRSSMAFGQSTGEHCLQIGIDWSSAVAARASNPYRIAQGRVGSRRTSGTRTSAQTTAIACGARCRGLGRHCCQSLLPYAGRTRGDDGVAIWKA